MHEIAESLPYFLCVVDVVTFPPHNMPQVKQQSLLVINVLYIKKFFIVACIICVRLLIAFHVFNKADCIRAVKTINESYTFHWLIANVQ